MVNALDKFSGMTNTDRKFEHLILGLGKTGVSCVSYLSGRSRSFAIADSRFDPPGLEKISREYPDIPVYLGAFDPDILATAQELIVSPGIAVSEPAIQKALHAGVKIIGDIELFCRHVAKPVIAVTGSNGKSTVASLISSMISASGKTAELGGNIGTPALDLIGREAPDYYVLELSSFQLETTNSLRAVAAVILNISEDHMDRYSNIDVYASVKQRIYENAENIVINLDDEILSGLAGLNKKCLCYSTDSAIKGDFGIHQNNARMYITNGQEDLIDVSDLPLRGMHNISNVLAALALGTIINLPIDSMVSALRGFKGLPHRCQFVANIHGVDWFNDSKATNVGACCAAVEGLAGDCNLILIAGGQGKGADFTRLAETAGGRVKAAILMGTDAGRMGDVLNGVTEVYFALDMDAAVILAKQISTAGDVVLLSPACASFDMFDDYQHRGSKFMEAVTGVEQQC